MLLVFTGRYVWDLSSSGSHIVHGTVGALHPKVLLKSPSLDALVLGNLKVSPSSTTAGCFRGPAHRFNLGKSSTISWDSSDQSKLGHTHWDPSNHMIIFRATCSA